MLRVENMTDKKRRVEEVRTVLLKTDGQLAALSVIPASGAKIHSCDRICFSPYIAGEVLKLLAERVYPQRLRYVHRHVSLLVVIGVLELEH